MPHVCRNIEVNSSKSGILGIVILVQKKINKSRTMMRGLCNLFMRSYGFIVCAYHHYDLCVMTFEERQTGMEFLSFLAQYYAPFM